MDKKTAAVDLYNNHNVLCSQAVLAAYAKELGITQAQALSIGTAFGTGMRRGEVCGACTGALMVLGLKYGQQDIGDPESRRIVYEKTAEFLRKFEEAKGSCICQKLLGYDPSTEDGLRHIRENRLFEEFCPTLVKAAMEILEEMGV